MGGALLHVAILLTVVWLMFLLASSSIALVVKPMLEAQSPPLMSVARTLVGLAIFGLWIFAWGKITEKWLFKILLRRGR